MIFDFSSREVIMVARWMQVSTPPRRGYSGQTQVKPRVCKPTPLHPRISRATKAENNPIVVFEFAHRLRSVSCDLFNAHFRQIFTQTQRLNVLSVAEKLWQSFICTDRGPLCFDHLGFTSRSRKFIWLLKYQYESDRSHDISQSK